MFITLGYAFLKTETVSSNTREISSDIFDGNPIVIDPNNPEYDTIYGIDIEQSVLSISPGLMGKQINGKLPFLYSMKQLRVEDLAIPTLEMLMVMVHFLMI